MNFKRKLFTSLLGLAALCGCLGAFAFSNSNNIKTVEAAEVETYYWKAVTSVGEIIGGTPTRLGCKYNGNFYYVTNMEGHGNYSDLKTSNVKLEVETQGGVEFIKTSSNSGYFQMVKISNNWQFAFKVAGTSNNYLAVADRNWWYSGDLKATYQSQGIPDVSKYQFESGNIKFTLWSDMFALKSDNSNIYVTKFSNGQKVDNAQYIYCQAYQLMPKSLVTLDNQGATTPGTESIKADYKMNMPTITVPTKTGYTFGGYYTGINGTGTKYYNADGSSAKTFDKTSATTLYAYWTANSYTVSLDSQGGTGGTSTVTATFDASMPPINIPTKTGYNFMGYFDALENGIKYYNNDGSSAHNWDKTSSTTLYAIWDENWCLIDDKTERTLSSGFYYIDADTIYEATKSGESGLIIEENSTVYINIAKGKTLTCIGADGEGIIGGGAGIHLPESSTLHLLGNGSVIAIGGDAAQGESGKAGENGWFNITKSSPLEGYYGGGTGGNGGNGGGGAGAGIGTPGGNGGLGGAGGFGTSSWLGHLDGDINVNSKPGDNGQAGLSSSQMGSLYKSNNLTINAQGGKANSTSSNGGSAGRSLYDSIASPYCYWTAGGAGGGGAGGNGYPGADIGTGGGGGGGGGGGASADAVNENYYANIRYTKAGGGAGGKGYVDGTKGANSESTTLYLQWKQTVTKEALGGLHDLSTPKDGGESGQAGNVAISKLSENSSGVSYNLTYLDVDGSIISSFIDTYIAGVSTSIVLPSLKGYSWVLTIPAESIGGTNLTVVNGELLNGTQDVRDICGDITFKAVPNTYTISLDLQGGTGGTSTVTATFDASMPPITLPTRDYCDFNGYFTGLNGKGTKYYNADGTSARNWDIASDTTLYAYWTKSIENFSREFLDKTDNKIYCDGSLDQSIKNDLIASFKLVDSEGIDAFKNAEWIRGQVEILDDVVNAKSRYCYMVIELGIDNHDDFLDIFDDAELKALMHRGSIVSLFNDGENGTSVILVASLSILAITTISAYILFRKRKEE